MFTRHLTRTFHASKLFRLCPHFRGSVHLPVGENPPRAKARRVRQGHSQAEWEPKCQSRHYLRQWGRHQVSVEECRWCQMTELLWISFQRDSSFRWNIYAPWMSPFIGSFGFHESLQGWRMFVSVTDCFCSWNLNVSCLYQERGFPCFPN